jgi:hypothetical protein
MKHALLTLTALLLALLAPLSTAGTIAKVH